jgi:hypothetical protein
VCVCVFVCSAEELAEENLLGLTTMTVNVCVLYVSPCHFTRSDYHDSNLYIFYGLLYYSLCEEGLIIYHGIVQTPSTGFGEKE